MKRKIALLIAAAMTMSLIMTGCGGSNSSETGSSSVADSNAETDSNAEADSNAGTEASDTGTEAPSGDNVLAGLTIGFAQTDADSAWRTTESDSIRQYVEGAGGEFVERIANGDVPTQASNIRDLIALQVDYLIVAPLESEGLQAPLQEAMEAGIPTILVDRAINGEAGTYFTTAIMSDFVWEGEQCAKAVVDALPDGGKVVIIHGGQESATSTDRWYGFRDALGDKFEIIAEQNGNWLMADAQNVMDNILAANDDIDVVFSVTDDMTQGAMNAIEATGLTPGEDILTLGIDGTRAALEAVASGKQLASCTCDPHFGPIVLETLTTLVSGGTVDTHITLPDTLYTIDNVDVEMGF